jgi:hypothetical protein
VKVESRWYLYEALIECLASLAIKYIGISPLDRKISTLDSYVFNQVG